MRNMIKTAILGLLLCAAPVQASVSYSSSWWSSAGGTGGGGIFTTPITFDGTDPDITVTSGEDIDILLVGNSYLDINQGAHNKALRIYGFDTASAETLQIYLNSVGMTIYSSTGTQTWLVAGAYGFSFEVDGDSFFQVGDGTYPTWDAETAIGAETQIEITHATGASALLLTRDEGAITTTEILGAIRFEGNDSANTNMVGAAISAVATAEWGTAADTSDSPASLVFWTTPDGTGALVHRMQIGSEGVVAVGDGTYPTWAAATLLGVEIQAEVSGIGGGTLFLDRDDTSVTSGNAIGTVKFGAKDPGAQGTGALMRAEASAEWGTAGDTSDFPTDLYFATVPDGTNTLTERMRISSEGAVQVGDGAYPTWATSTLLGVENQIEIASAVAAEFILTRADSTIADTNTIGRIDFEGIDNSLRSLGARIQVAATQDWDGTTDFGTKMSFQVSDNTASTLTERMLINSDGVVSVGDGTYPTWDTQTLLGVETQIEVTSGGSTGAVLLLTRDDASIAADERLFRITAEGNDTDQPNGQGAAIEAWSDNAWTGAADTPGRLEFYTTPDDSASITLAMTIESDQSVTFDGGSIAIPGPSSLTFTDTNATIDGWTGYLTLEDGYVVVGDTTTNDTMDGDGDLLVEDELEVNGAIRLDQGADNLGLSIYGAGGVSTSNIQIALDGSGNTVFSTTAGNSMTFNTTAGAGNYDFRTNGTSMVQLGDGSYSWGHSPEFGVEGVSEFDGVAWFDGFARFNSNVYMSDDIPLVFGGGSDAIFRWETADANANDLRLVLPEGGATEVPVFTVGDTTMGTTDLGFFDGITEPTLAVMNDAADAYATLNSTSLSLAGTSSSVTFSGTNGTIDGWTGYLTLEDGYVHVGDTISAACSGAADGDGDLCVEDELIVDGSITVNDVGKVQAGSITGIVDATATDVFTITTPADGFCGVHVDYTVTVTDASDYQAHTGGITFSVINDDGTTVCDESTDAMDSTAVSAGTLTGETWACADDGTSPDTIEFTINSSLDVASTLYWTATIMGSAGCLMTGL